MSSFVENDPIQAVLRSVERTPLTELQLKAFDQDSYPDERAYQNRYGQLSDQLFWSFLDSIDPAYQERFMRGDVRHGFRIVGSLLRLAPPAYIEFCEIAGEAPELDTMASILHDSVETPLAFSRMSNRVNKHVESQFGLRSADAEYSMEFADSGNGMRYKPVQLDFVESKLRSGFFDEEHANKTAGRPQPQCPAQRIIREAWHSMINTCQADPTAFMADIKA